MDDPNMTMEEYIKLEEEKARRRGRVSEYNEEEQNILYFNDLFSFNIIRPDDLKLEKDNDDNDIDIMQSFEGKLVSKDGYGIFGYMALLPREQRHRFLKYEGLEYSDADIADFEVILARIYKREVHRVQVFDFGGLTDLMAKGLSARMLMEHQDDQGAILDLDTLGTLQFQLGRARRRISWREFILALGLHTDEEMISFVGYFLGTVPSYTMIRDPFLRLCHRLIACSIAGRSQAPEKVTVTDLFYLRGMDVDSVNVPYLLARYLRLFAAGRKSRAHIFGGQFRQSNAVTSAPAIAEDAPAVDQGLVRLEEDMQGLRRDVGSLHGLVERSMTDQGRFSMWMMSCMNTSCWMLASRLTYKGILTCLLREFTCTAFRGRTKQRTSEASTSTAQQDPHEPDP
ncbi:hypothetical protein Tco_1417490 [Tanacetum coccineum]